MIDIRLFGGLTAQDGTRAISGEAAQPRRLAVLALVARAGQRGISRDRLLALVWPDSAEESARRSLSQALYSLRQGLGSDELFLGVQELRLNPDAAVCDVAEFEAALARHDHGQAVGYYHGPFLEGFRVPGAPDLDRWIEEERSRLAHRYADALERLARRSAEQDDALAAAGWWRRLAGLDPLNARIAVELMRSLAAAGERHAALQHARIYEALVEQELAIEPDPQVRELADRLRSQTAPAQAVTPQVAAKRHDIVSSDIGSPPSEAAAAARPARRASRHRLIGIASMVVVALVAITALAVHWMSAGSTIEHPSLIAVGFISDTREEAGDLADPMAEMLATNLARVRGLQVLSTGRLFELMQAGADPGDRGAWSAAARRAGATEVLEGGLHRLRPGRLLLELRRVELSSGTVLTAYRLEAADPFELVERMTAEIAASLGFAGRGLDPGDVSTRSLVAVRFYQEGLALYGRGDYRSAEQLFDAAIAEDSTLAMALYYRSLTRSSRWLEPHAYDVERLRRLADRVSDRERLLIKGWLALTEDEHAILAVAETLAVRYPAELDGHYMLGLARVRSAEFPRAIPHFERVLALDSVRGTPGPCRACEALEQLIVTYYSMDSLPKAERLARDWVRLDSVSFRAWSALASVLSGQHRPEEAIRARRIANLHSPFDAFDVLFPASEWIRAGDFDAADRLTRSLLKDSPDTDNARNALWVLLISLRNQERWEEALALVRERRRLLPSPERDGWASLLAISETLILIEAGRPLAAAAISDSLAAPAYATELAARRAHLKVIYFTLSTVAYAAAGDRGRLDAAADSAARWAESAYYPRHAYLVAHTRALRALARADTTTAISEFERAIFSPTLGFTRTNRDLGALLVSRDEPDRAIAVLAAALRGTMQALNLYVTQTDLHDLLAQAYRAAGQPDSAAHHERWVQTARAKRD